MAAVDTNWPWYKYFGFLALVLASLLASSFVLYSITDTEASTKEYYIGIFVLLIIILIGILLWRKGKTDTLAAFVIGVAPPSSAALFIWFTGL